MKLANRKICSTATAALLSFPVATGAALAQSSQESDQTGAQSAQDTGQQQQAEQPSAGSGQATGRQQQDAVVATVGDAEIRGSDVLTVIGALPPQLQSQPQQMLVPMALDQLILRELIIEDARSQNLAEDPEVVALVENSAQTAEDDAMVQVWLDREMANVVTDAAVQQLYDEAQAQSEQDLPPLDELRPQIQQHLRQQAMQDIRARLRQGAEIVFYDPSGQPVEQPQDGSSAPQGQSSQNGSGAVSGTSKGQSGGTSGTQSGGNTGGTSDTRSTDDAGEPPESSTGQSQGN